MSSLFAFDQDPIWEVLERFLVTILVLVIVIRLIYFRYSRKKRNIFPFFQMGIMIFLVCILLKSVEIQLGIALGLFAIFAITRFRSENLRLKEMSYFFTVIGVSVINAMANFYNPVRGTILVNSIIILSVLLLEVLFNKREPGKKKKKKSPGRTVVIYNRLELLDPDRKKELLNDIISRTNIKVDEVEIKKIDLVKGSAEIEIYFGEKVSKHG
jgi:hypothetical protein